MLNGYPRILVIRLSAIGDVVRVLPAVHALRDSFPGAQIDWAVEPKSADILMDHPAIDQVLIFDRSDDLRDGVRKFRSFSKMIRENRYDKVVDFHGILKSGLIMRASGAKERYAFAAPRAQEGSQLFAKKRVALPSKRMNRIEENLELARAVGAQSLSFDVALPVPDEIQDDIDAFIEEAFDSGKRLVIVHAPVDRPEKQWPIPHYIQLVDMLLGDGRFEVVLTWGPGQREAAREIEVKSARSPEMAPELPTLKHFAALCARSCLFFGGDTGPMHIASAMGIPTVAVFGGTDPKMHAPLRSPSTVLYAGPEERTKAIDHEHAAEWLEKVSPDEAFDACIELIKCVSNTQIKR